MWGPQCQAEAGPLGSQALPPSPADQARPELGAVGEALPGPAACAVEGAGPAASPGLPGGAVPPRRERKELSFPLGLSL